MTETDHTTIHLQRFVGKTIKKIESISAYCRENEIVEITFEDNTILTIEASTDCGEPQLFIPLED